MNNKSKLENRKQQTRKQELQIELSMLALWITKLRHHEVREIHGITPSCQSLASKNGRRHGSDFWSCRVLGAKPPQFCQRHSQEFAPAPYQAKNWTPIRIEIWNVSKTLKGSHFGGLFLKNAWQISTVVSVYLHLGQCTKNVLTTYPCTHMVHVQHVLVVIQILYSCLILFCSCLDISFCCLRIENSDCDLLNTSFGRCWISRIHGLTNNKD